MTNYFKEFLVYLPSKNYLEVKIFKISWKQDREILKIKRDQNRASHPEI